MSEAGSAVRDPVPDRSRLVQLPFGRVFVDDRGPGSTAAAEAPPIVLLHGFLVTHYEFRRLIPLLAAERRVLAFDLPGSGDSDRPPPAEVSNYSFPWIAEAISVALEVLEIPCVDLVGHSMGGAIAVCLAQQFPQRVRRLALVDSLCFTVPLPLEGRLALAPLFGGVLFRRLYRRADLRRYLEGIYSTPELADDTAIDVYWDRLGREGGREAAHALLRQIADLDHLRERFGAVECPTLAIWGDRDPLVPIEMGERMVELLPDARLAVIEGSGHAPNEERPKELAIQLLKHFV